MERAATSGAAGRGFRTAMRHFPTAVAVLTVQTGSGPAGMTAGSVTSVSMSPELLSVCLRRGSRLTAAMADSGGFVVNLLQEHQSDVAQWFSSDERFDLLDEFRDVGWHPAPVGGHPVLAGAACVVECRTAGQVPSGDHVLTVGRVASCRIGGCTRPLISYRGRFRGLDGDHADGAAPRPA